MIKVSKSVFPEERMSFNEWAEHCNVSVNYIADDQNRRGGHYYPLPPLNTNPDSGVVRLINYFKNLLK